LLHLSWYLVNYVDEPLPGVRIDPLKKNPQADCAR